MTGGSPYYDPEFDEDDTVEPPRRRIRWFRWLMRGLGLFIILFVIAVIWLAVTAPLSKSLKPLAPPSITLLSAEGKPIARRGAIIAAPVDASNLPKRVTNAFIAIEDRRFYSHWGVDPRGIVRAFLHNSFSGGSLQGASTITQQLAKNAFLDSDRTVTRKLREVLIAFWLEAWLTKDQILSRYLSNVYFGDNVYGLRAAAEHYFSRSPEDLTTGQAAMLAGLVKAPSRLAPTGNLKGARAREAVVVHAMQEAGFLSTAEADAVKPVKLRVHAMKELPSGGYFADWVLPDARDRAGEIVTDETVRTTLDSRLQRAAERAVQRAHLNKAQVAMVVMRPDGRVVAMVGGRNYDKSPFNRAVQARRQPGSTFKLFVYLAALRSGMTPDSIVEDKPVTIGKWSPENAEKRYLGPIPLTRAFAISSNVAAARLTNQVGPGAVIRAARDLGITTPIPDEATIALGTADVSLLELTAAYASIAAGKAPVKPRGLAATDDPDTSWLSKFSGGTRQFDPAVLAGMRKLLAASVDYGTSRGAALSIPTYGKTGTTQDGRDALFIGYAGGLVTGVWMGNDDNTPNPGLFGGGPPARIWRDFMTHALGVSAYRAPVPANDDSDDDSSVEKVIPLDGIHLNKPLEFNGLGLNLRIDRDGSIRIGNQPPPPPAPPPADRQRAPGSGDEGD
ncbi:transglycosylase domain-containing protein [Stakelama sediminis]|uniref:transglycosylase domain-containing protein n=1 Tax=Stakelama sediminis TaxID=463200 RepID=UPI001FE943EE|nr:PBP1A family penicillin-binding protein [Stakelama sediminis]